jgi:hypothetical protein
MADFQVLPCRRSPLEAREAMRDDIAANGVLVPILVDQHGAVIDGYRRLEIGEEGRDGGPAYGAGVLRRRGAP